MKKNSNNSPQDPQVTRPGISGEFLSKAGVRRITDTEAHSLVGLSQSGLVIPYFDLEENPVEDGGIPFSVVRLDHPTRDQKYHQRKGSELHIYLPPGLGELMGDAAELIIVEGEFKAMSLVQRGIAAVGIKGFFGSVRDGALHPELRAVLGRFPDMQKLIFLGDTDTTINPDFSAAVQKLLAASDGLELELLRLPYCGPKGVDDVYGNDPEFDLSALARIQLSREEHSGSLGRAAIVGAILAHATVGEIANVITNGSAKLKSSLWACLYLLQADAVLAAQWKDQLIKLTDLCRRDYGRMVASGKRQRGVTAADSSRVTEVIDGNCVLLSHKLPAMRVGDGRWVAYGSWKSFELGLSREYGLSMQRGTGDDGGSQTDDVRAQLEIQETKWILCERLAGWPAGLHESEYGRFLVIDGMEVMKGESGNWSTIRKAIQNLCGREAGDPEWEIQYNTLMGFLQQARREYQRENLADFYQAQVLVLMGPVGSGKSWVQTDIISPALTDRKFEGHLDTLMSRFNAEIANYEFLIFSDPSGGESWAARKELAKRIRQIVTTGESPIERKGQDRYTLPARNRISISINEDGIDGLPALKAGVEDKIIMLKCYRVGMFSETKDPGSKKRVTADLRAQLPAFCDVIDNFRVPTARRCDRYGVRDYHHPEVIQIAHSGGSQEIAREAIHELLSVSGNIEWKTAREIRGDLEIQAVFNRFEISSQQFPHVLRELVAQDPDQLGFRIAEKKDSHRRVSIYWIGRIDAEVPDQSLDGACILADALAVLPTGDLKKHLSASEWVDLFREKLPDHGVAELNAIQLGLAVTCLVKVSGCAFEGVKRRRGDGTVIKFVLRKAAQTKAM
jgi:hypothetical protein